MTINNKKCLCCSTKFSYCPDCSKADALKPSWASEFCSEDCMTIWTTATSYNIGKTTKSEAKSVISKLNIKPIEQYEKCVQRDLNNILTESPKSGRGKRAKLLIVDETSAEVNIEPSKDVACNKETHEVVDITEE